MMAARFRSVTWVAIALVPALGCYLVTQYVAAERAQLARVERQIGQSRKAIRDLETELGTRGSMAQIERWNTQTLALTAPAASQYIDANVQLASLSALPRDPRAALPAIATAPAAVAATVQVRQAGYQAARPQGEARQAAVRQAAFHADRPAPGAPASGAEVRPVAFHAVGRPAAEPEAEPRPLLRQATYARPARDAARAAPTRIAMIGEPLDARTLADIGRIAKSERRR